jgi:TonB family protein
VSQIDESPNKGMKLTSAERIGRSQLIPGVRRTVGGERVKGRTRTAWLTFAAGFALLLPAGVSSQDVSSAPAVFAVQVKAKADALGLKQAVDEMPEPLKISRPKYPKAAFEACVEGTVFLAIVVDSTGRVALPEVVKSVPGLDDAALSCVKTWRFKPARRNGQPTGYVAIAPVAFRIYGQDTHEGCRQLLLAGKPGEPLR